MYRAFLLMESGAADLLPRLASSLRNAYRERYSDTAEVSLTGSVLRLIHNGWKLEVGYEDQDHISRESAKIAARHATDHPDRSAIAGCDSRLVVDSDADPCMRHFNDFLAVVHCAEGLTRLHVFDRAAASFL